VWSGHTADSARQNARVSRSAPGDLLVGIDVGTTTTKVVLAALEHGRVRELRTAVGVTPARAEELVDLLAHLCRDVVGESGTDVVAVGVASMAETGVPVDAAGAPLTPLLRWDAGLGADDAARLSGLSPEVFAATGVRLSDKTPLTTWGWLRRERPDAWSRMACWLGAADVVVHALTGRSVTDHTLAGRTGGYRLPARDQAPPDGFDADLLALVGMIPERLPHVAGPEEIAGTITAAAAVRWRLRPGTPVVVGGHDHQVAAWAAGVRASGDVADSLGTAEAVLTVLAGRPDPEAVRTQGMSLVRTVAGDHDAVVAGSSSAGARLRSWLDGTDDPDAVLDAATRDRDTDPRPTGAAATPYLRGRQAPAPDHAARPGEPPSSWPPERRLRAVVEGICYQSRWMIDAHRAAPAPRRVTVIAGSRLPRLWTDVLTDVLPWSLARASASEPVATGAALLAAARAGVLDLEDPLRRAPVLADAAVPPPNGDPHAAAFARFVREAETGTAAPSQ